MKERTEICPLFFFNINTLYSIYIIMVQKYDEFFNEENQLNEEQQTYLQSMIESVWED